jgi:LPXTG-site transpeptidase (sortase) family protein
MKSVRRLHYIGGTLMIAGLVGLVPMGYFWVHSRQAIAAAPTISAPVIQLPTTPDVVSGHPVHLSIPSVGVDLTIIDGTYNAQNGTWTLTTDKAQYAVPTVEPNNYAGNTLIYGHYRKNVFASLHTIQPGAQAVITTDNGYTFTYAYDKSDVVDPTNTDIFAYQGTPRLTVQTCTGAFFQNRQFFYFNYTSYQK